MNLPMHAVVESAAFTAQLRKLDVSASERPALYVVYSSNPEHGSVLKGAGGLCKGRIAKDETGKSG